MEEIKTLLDKAKETCSIASDNALAALFGVHRQAVSKWRNGDAYPSEEHIARLAEMAGEDAGEWLVKIQMMRASGKAAAAWSSVFRRLATAALIVLMMGPAVLASGLTSIMSNRTGRKRRSYAVCASSLAAMSCT